MSFLNSINQVLVNEGGYANNPADPGGETNFGICKRSYPDIDIKNLTEDQAVAIYRRDFWDKCRCDDLPESVRCLVFDTAVNQGCATAVKLLQEALALKQDSVIGPVTIAAAKSKNGSKLIRDFTVARVMRYIHTNNFDKFGEAWIKRAIGMALNC